MSDTRDLPLPSARSERKPECIVEVLRELSEDDLHALCEAANAAIIEGGGFGWLKPPGQRALESYFRGVMLVPERELFVARLDGGIVGSAQLVGPPRNNEAQATSATVMHAFVAPYARGQGLGRLLTKKVEEGARSLGYNILNLDVRETQAWAIHLYESLGYTRWGEHPCYARVAGQSVRGYFYYKQLRAKTRKGG